MKTTIKYLLISVALLVSINFPVLAWSRDQPPFIEKLLQGDDAVVVTGVNENQSPVVTLGRRFGGSVVSLYYRGVEYVNNHNAKNEVDYGRQLQSAVAYREGKVLFNPTEAGGSYDRGNQKSSSLLLSVDRPQSNILVTQSDMAFWNFVPDHEKKNKKCIALNSDCRDGYILKRTIQVGVDGYPNVIYYKTQFVSPVEVSKPRYEVLGIHTPTIFTRIFRITGDGQAQEVIGKAKDEGNLPYMVTTGDQKHAVVVCSTLTASNEGFYNFRKYPNTTPTRFLYYGQDLEKESRVFDNYVIVGTATETKEATAKFCFKR